MINVVEWTRLEPWRVARARTDRDETVIVKWMGPHAARTHSEAWRLRTEVAALRFLSEDLGVDLAPRVLAEDLPAGRVVLEDLAPRAALDGLLRRDGAGAHAERLVAFARARGELGALTAGRAEPYYRRRSGLGPVDPESDRLRRVTWLRTEGAPHAETLGVPVTGAAERELAEVAEELSDPGPFLALSNGDPEANNVLVHDGGPPDARLIDFEFAGFTHALHDAVCLHVPGPAWMTVSAAPGFAPLPDLAGTYRHALAAGVPEAEDERRYGRALAAACVLFALGRLRRLPALETRPAGDDSRTQLVAILEAAAHTAGTHRALPHVAGLCRHLAEAVRRRWPDTDVDLTALAPYTPRRR
ncbi:aminoglycoside phosphotransferase family protein [Nonomuraea phyllanthi]|uniref:phosphotransferase n=1 Tax=Nonomuraea phyllanthi TaxID=2219224 RepID=UPI001D14798F|nr:phosphotransferase [Nonomuraea phyllanthi]